MGEEFALRVMNAYEAEPQQTDGVMRRQDIGFSLYGTPAEISLLSFCEESILKKFGEH